GANTSPVLCSGPTASSGGGSTDRCPGKYSKAATRSGSAKAPGQSATSRTAIAPLQLDEAQTRRFIDSLPARVHGKLTINAVDVGLDGVVGDGQEPADVAEAEALRHQGEYLRL